MYTLQNPTFLVKALGFGVKEFRTRVSLKGPSAQLSYLPKTSAEIVNFQIPSPLLVGGWTLKTTHSYIPL